MTKNFIQANPRAYSYESNDCTVRATTLAMGLDYIEVHKKFTSAGRKERRGVTLHVMEKALSLITGKSKRFSMGYEAIKNRHPYDFAYPSFAKFAKLHPKGKFIVIKRGHAVALINGVWYDAHADQVGSRCIVKAYYQIEE